jgi:hypothetical protein
MGQSVRNGLNRSPPSRPLPVLDASAVEALTMQPGLVETDQGANTSVHWDGQPADNRRVLMMAKPACHPKTRSEWRFKSLLKSTGRLDNAGYGPKIRFGCSGDTSDAQKHSCERSRPGTILMCKEIISDPQ